MYSHLIILSSGEYVNKKVAACLWTVVEYGAPVHSAWPFLVNVNLSLNKLMVVSNPASILQNQPPLCLNTAPLLVCTRSAFGYKYTTAAISPQIISVLMEHCNVSSVRVNSDSPEGTNVNYNFQFPSWLRETLRELFVLDLFEDRSYFSKVMYRISHGNTDKGCANWCVFSSWKAQECQQIDLKSS